MNELQRETEVRVRLRDGCPGGSAPHHPAEDGAEGRITALTGPDDQPYFVLFRRALLLPSAAFPRRVLGRHDAGNEGRNYRLRFRAASPSDGVP